MTLEQSWYKRWGWSLLLWPLSVVFAALSALRRLCFKLGVLKSHKVAAPVVVVGNISVGGTGKTPFTLWLCDYLQQQGLKPGILSRGYGVKLTEPTLVQPSHSAADVGDEPRLLASASGRPVLVWPNRVEGALALLAKTDVNILICDDGLQHYALQRDLEIVLIDGQRGLGNGCLLPAGPLREGAWRLKCVDLVLSNSGASVWTPHQLTLQALPAQPVNPASMGLLTTGCAVSIVTGIGNPNRFVDTVQQAGFTVQSSHFFPDHHAFQPADFAGVKGPILMTTKDAVKCQSFANDDWFMLPVQATPDPQAIALISQQLTRLRTSYGI
ncbi:MAG TPA: tetraacyldisaccharide 4'-kinase [Rheinheimera sp.]|nr:tetraacyldisaccharide 4'-kinase [Rheinheimera sp.]